MYNLILTLKTRLYSSAFETLWKEPKATTTQIHASKDILEENDIKENIETVFCWCNVDLTPLQTD